MYDCASYSGAGEDYSALKSKVVRNGGSIVSLNGGVFSWVRALCGFQRRADKLMMTRQNGAELTEFVKVLRGNPSPVIDSVHPLSEAGVAAAFARLKSRRARGKVLFDMAAVPP